MTDKNLLNAIFTDLLNDNDQNQAICMLSKSERSFAFALTLILGFISTLVYCFAPIYADTSVDDTVDPYYIGFGAGTSFLQADADSATLKLNNDSDFAYKVFAGYQFDKHWSGEIFWAELGDSEISTRATGDVVGLAEYQSFGVGGLYQYPIDESWKVFATAGVGTLNNNFQYINIDQSNDSFVYTGVGVTWSMAKTWDLRAEYDFYNSNAQFLSLNIVTRFGAKTAHHQGSSQAETLESSAAFSASTIVKNKTCEDFYVNFDGVIFAQGSIELNAKAQLTLNDLVSRLLELPQDIRFEIRAHTDDVGNELFNYQLSLTRARVVRDYLASRGIALSRMDAYGYGEWLVKGDNSSSAGRKHNRRAELVLLGVEKYVADTSRCPLFAKTAPVPLE